MRLLVIVAGTNEPSNSNVLADSFIEGMKKVEGAQITKYRLKDLHIEHFKLCDYVPHAKSQDDFAQIEDAVTAADGIVIATPIWNFSVPAHLKNLIDRIGAFALDEATHSKGQLKRKPFFLVYTGGAPMIAWKALMYLTTLHMTEAIKYYDGIVVGRHFEPKCLPKRGEFGLVVDKRPRSLETMRQRGERFAKLTKHFAETGKLPAGKQLSYKIFTFLYRVGNRIMYPISTQQ